MRETVPFIVSAVSMSPGPWWLKPLWSLRQQVEVKRMFNDGMGSRQESLIASSSHFVCWMVIDADTIANASYVTKIP